MPAALTHPIAVAMPSIPPGKPQRSSRTPVGGGGCAIILLVVSLLAGCGGDDDPDPKPVTPAAVQTVSGLLSACADMELDTPQVHDASVRVTGHVNRLIRQFSEKPD